MSPNQVLDLSSLYMIGLMGLLAGGIVSYVANLLLCYEGFVSPVEHGSYCSHRGSIMEAIPFISLLLLEGKCENCRSRIKWQYLLCEVFTALAFTALAWRFGFNFYSFGMMFFVAILAAICITDFKAKIIPHEITYPSIILGIIFSAITKSNVLGALAGIGASYILFDFLAFYGLKFYLWFRPSVLAAGKTFVSKDSAKSSGGRKINCPLLWISKESHSQGKKISKREYGHTMLHGSGVLMEEIEIIGGGDAVLSALISAWLGWQKLIAALILGFLVGTFLGAIYVLIELRKERLLHSIIFPVISAVIGLSVFSAIMLFMLATCLKESVFLMPYQYILPGAALIGCLLGVVIAGAKISKPFPFGPALAIGAMIAIFRNE